MLLHLLVLSGTAWQAATLCWYTCRQSTQGGQYLSAWYTDTTTCLFVRKKQLRPPAHLRAAVAAAADEIQSQGVESEISKLDTT